MNKIAVVFILSVAVFPQAMGINSVEQARQHPIVLNKPAETLAGKILSFKTGTDETVEIKK